MGRTSPESAAQWARRGEPNNALVLIMVMALSVVSLVGVAAMLNLSPDRPRWEINLHMTASQLAVILPWFLAHIYFGLHYMRLYYDDTVVDGKTSYQTGLEFPQRETVDIWDFMYYSFTIYVLPGVGCHRHLGEDPPHHPRARDFLVSPRERDHRFRGQRHLECYVSGSRAVIATLAALILVALAAASAMAQSASQSVDTITGPPVPRPKHKPINLDIEALSLDFTQDIAKFLNDPHDEYRGYKKEIRRDYDAQYSMLVSIFPHGERRTAVSASCNWLLTQTSSGARSKIRPLDRGRLSSRCCKPSTGPRRPPNRNAPS
jgi:hypothetical protein